MGRKFLAALLAAVSIVPAAAPAQDRGERGAGRGGGWQQRQSGGEAGWQQRRQAQAPAGGRQQRAERPAPSGGWQQRTQRPASSGGWQQRQPQQQQGPSGSVQQRPQRQAPPAGWEARRDSAAQAQSQRRDDRRGGESWRQRDGQRFQPGQANRSLQRTDERRAAIQRGWVRSSADRIDQRRWDANRGYRADQRGWYGGRDDRGGWNRDWRRDSRYNWSGWRQSNRNAFRLPRYYAPYGWNAGYRQFGIGAVLSSVLFAQNYWINDPYAYRLPETDGPYRWVRYYNDALLVDVYSGEVVDVVHDIFW